MDDSINFQTIACLTTSYNNIIDDIERLEKNLSRKDKYKPCELMAFTNFHNLLSAFIEIIDEQQLTTFKDYKNIHDLYYKLFNNTLIKKDEYKEILKSKMNTNTQDIPHVCNLYNDLFFDLDDDDDKITDNVKSLYS